MNSYLSVLKKTLFSISEPSTHTPTTENKKALKENWIYISSECNSTTGEVINLNETFENNGTTTDPCDQANLNEMAEEIRKNRELWLKKRISASASQRYSGSSTRNIKKTKLKVHTRKRNANSSSPAKDENNCETASLASEGSNASQALSESHSQKEEEAEKAEKRTFNASPKLKASKRSKLQCKFKPYSRAVRTLNQPAAKGMC